MVKNILYRLLLLGIFVGCSVQSRKEQSDYRNLFTQKNFQKATGFLEDSSLKKDKKNELLYLMEKGNLYYYQKRYAQAGRVFVRANELVDKLYTKSIREALASSLINDNSNSFYASLFERSQLYQYQALSFYQLARQGFKYETKLVDAQEQEVKIKLSEQDINKNMGRVRSTLIAWDSFFQEFSRQKKIKTFLKNDILAKIIAGELHEALGKRRDREVALQLYKDAYAFLVEVGPAQKIFNKNYKDYNKNLKDYYNNDGKKPKLVTQDLTAHYHQLKDNLVFKILRLTKRVRRNQYKKMQTRYRPSDLVRKKLKQKQSNVSIIIEEGFIAPLKGKNFAYNLRSAIDNLEDEGTKRLIRGIGVPVLTYFALGPLGLGAVSRHGNVTVFTRHSVGETMTEEVGIEFELPYAQASKDIGLYELEISQNNEVIQRVELASLSSLSDYAFINAQEMIANSFTKRASRVGVKYIAAIIAAYTTYSNLKERSGEFFAKPAAMAQFLLSQKGIKESEKADVRHWSSLPATLFNAELYLGPGDYQIKYLSYDSLKQKIRRVIDFGTLKISSRKKNLFTYRTF